MRKPVKLNRIVSILSIAGLASALAIAEAPHANAEEDRAPSAPTASSLRDELALSEVLSSARSSLPALLAAQADVDQAQAELLTADGGFDPTWRTNAHFTPVSGYPSWQFNTVVEQPTPLWGASLFAGYRLGLGDYAEYDGKLATNDYGEVRGGVRVPILRDGPIDRRRANVERAELGVEVAELSREQQLLEVARVAGLRYWDWVAAGERKAWVNAWLEVAELRDAQLRRRSAEGDLPDIEITENARSLFQRRAQAIAAQRALEQAAIELSIFNRSSAGPRIPSSAELPTAVPTPLPMTSSAGALGDALSSRPELKRVAALRSQAEVELELAINQSWPALDVYAATSVDLGPGDEKRAKPVFEFGVTLEVPLAFRKERGRIDAQRAALRKLDQQTATQVDRVTAEVRDAESALARALERYALVEQEVALALELEQAEKKRFDLGDGTLLFVNLREQATIEARLRFVDAKLDYQRALLLYRYALGEL
ncbi:MAG: TolC family protein [Polyangiaceae bacterium]